MVVLGTIAFALQIYCDFSAYSDIARGVANWFGFELMVNFNLPYFATSLREFWGRWHISLSTWLRDYLYIPLGGNRQGVKRTCLNLMITMGLAGLWHGAGAQFVLWGLWHGLGLAVQRLWSARPGHRPLPAWLGWGLTMTFVLFGWMMFRARSLGHLKQLTAAFTDWTFPPWSMAFLRNLLVLALPLALFEASQNRQRTTELPCPLGWWSKALLQGALLLGIVVFWEREASPFIYFQF
jgi:alginate O-acetyltransferase complex protein AlgI